MRFILIALLLVMIMGTNTLNQRFHRGLAQIRTNMKSLVASAMTESQSRRDLKGKEEPSLDELNCDGSDVEGWDQMDKSE